MLSKKFGPGKSLPEILSQVRLDADQFEAMLVCNRHLERCDSPAENLLGLYDPQEKVRYIIDESILFLYQSSPNPTSSAGSAATPMPPLQWPPSDGPVW